MNYPTYDFLLELHIYLMRDVWKESYYGPVSAVMLQAALARPMQAAHYEGADGIRQVKARLDLRAPLGMAYEQHIKRP